jgi:hypothetical protein
MDLLRTVVAGGGIHRAGSLEDELDAPVAKL